jgi:hypothetical protein
MKTMERILIHQVDYAAHFLPNSKLGRSRIVTPLLFCCCR